MVTEINVQTGEIIERDLTNEEAVLIQEMDNLPVAVPRSITPRQFKMSLFNFGVPLSQVEGIINSFDEPLRTYARVNWESSTSFDRHNEMLNQMAPALNLSHADLDEIFINGQNL